MNKKAEKQLKAFFQHVEKYGFTNKVKKYLTFAWNTEPDLFERLKNHLKGKELKFGKPKYITFDNEMKTCIFEVEINEKIHRFFVRFETETGTAFKYGKAKVIPIKLLNIKSPDDKELDFVSVD